MVAATASYIVPLAQTNTEASALAPDDAGVLFSDFNAFYSHKDTLLAALTQDGTFLYFASDALKADRGVVAAAVQKDGRALEYAADALKAEKDIVMAAVAQDGNALRHAAHSLRADKDVVMAAVKQSWMALQYASHSLRADKDVIVAAVTRGGQALSFAADDLKADKEVLMAAVTRDQEGDALMYAAECLKADKELVMAAVTVNGLAMKHAAQELLRDGDFLGQLLSRASQRILRKWLILRITALSGATCICILDAVSQALLRNLAVKCACMLRMPVMDVLQYGFWLHSNTSRSLPNEEALRQLERGKLHDLQLLLCQ